MTRFSAIVADPPWAFSDKLTMSSTPRGAEANYPVLNVEALCKLPVAAVSADPALLVLWVPSALLRDGERVMDAWGFTQKQTWVWVKTKKGVEEAESPDDCAFGMGRIARNCHEIALVGTRGGSFLPRVRNVRTVFFAPALPHSQKPECVQDAVEALTDGPYLELFARRQRAGWQTVGNEVPGMLGMDIRFWFQWETRAWI